ncbi:hypothetical protein D3C80_1652420 [compost metagenome]
MNSIAPIRGPAKAAVVMKKAPSKPPLQCHQVKLLSAANVGASRWIITSSNSAMVPTKNEINAAASTLETCLASCPLIPACSGKNAPATNGRHSNHQTGAGMLFSRESIGDAVYALDPRRVGTV